MPYEQMSVVPVRCSEGESSIASLTCAPNPAEWFNPYSGHKQAKPGLILLHVRIFCLSQHSYGCLI